MASIGECLIELNGAPFGKIDQTFGGDTLNTAVYLARLLGPEIEVQYVTAVGTDPLSEGLVDRWRAEAIETTFVLRDATRLPGLYWIQLDERGERRFLYWRGDSAARYLLQHPQFEQLAERFPDLELIYLSGVSLAILPSADRARLLDVLAQSAAGGVTIAFDNNYRPALWSSVDDARAAFRRLAPLARLVLVTFEDEESLWGDGSPHATLARIRAEGVSCVVVKLGAQGCLCGDDAKALVVPTWPVVNVVDTTAAGDAFNAGFLAGWLTGQNLQASCRIGHAVASVVIQHPGAIIPASATPTLGEAALATRSFEERRGP